MKNNTLVPILFLFVAILLSTAGASAATITVTNTLTTGPGSLAQAIADAAPGDTINFDFPFSGPITISGDFVIDKGLTIAGPGARSLILRSYSIPGRIFLIGVPSGATVNISGMTLEGITGFADRGIGIQHLGFGTLNLSEIVIRYCEWAILSDATTNIDRSSIHNNHPREPFSSPFPGPIVNGISAMSISNSTISDNEGRIAGAIYNFSGPLTITNSTIAYNQGYAGIYHYGFDFGILKVRNSIVAGNTGGVDIHDFNGAPGISLGNNLIGINEGATASFPEGSPNANGDYVGTLAAPLDASLGPLQNNGGPTDTRAITEGSVPFDHGNNCVVDLTCASFNPITALTTDQRGAGYARHSGANVDIGAFEVRVDPDERTEDLIAFIQSYNPRLHVGVENSLVAKLRSALIELSEGNETEAIGFLYDFISQVDAQRGKKLTAAQADQLIAAAEVILVSLR
jgi:hypothetical protein